MKKLIFAVFLIFSFVSLAQEENPALEEYKKIETIDNDVLSNEWINEYFLIKRISLYPVILEHMEELGITQEQIFNIKKFYVENFPEMLKKAKRVKELENELYDLTLHGGNPKSIKDKIIEIAKLKAELTAYNVKEIRTIQNILTTDQYENLLEYLK